MGIGVPALIVWIVAMWRRGGQYTGKMHRILALVGVVVGFGGFSLLTQLAVDNRVVSTYFGNIAFAYEDYGLPYCFQASLFNTGISQPNDYTEAKMEEIGENGTLLESTSDTGEFPNVLLFSWSPFLTSANLNSCSAPRTPFPI